MRLRMLLLALPPALLTGCGGIPIAVVYGLQATASAATIADKIVGIDVSLSQDTPGKTPVAKVLP